jgi:glycine hydroxymethyltransferase
MHIIAAKAVCLKLAMDPEFKVYQQQVVKNSAALANGLVSRGIKLVSCGTDNHLSLIDLREMGDLTGKELERRLDEVRITANKNKVPGDPRSPFQTSGLRVGSPAVTSRGLREEDMELIADCIDRVVEDFEKNADGVRADVNAICAKYPLYE